MTSTRGSVVERRSTFQMVVDWRGESEEESLDLSCCREEFWEEVRSER